MRVRGSMGASPEGAVMAEYLVLIYSNEESWAATDEAFSAKIMEGHSKFGEKHGASLRGGNALEPSTTATSIRTDAAGKSVTTAGPFAETTEAIGGCYVVEAADGLFGFREWAISGHGLSRGIRSNRGRRRRRLQSVAAAQRRAVLLSEFAMTLHDFCRERFVRGRPRFLVPVNKH